MGGKVILKNLDFPEGPAFDSKGNLWFVELHGGNVARLGVDGALARFRIDGGAPNGIAVDSSDKIWFCDAANDNVSILDPDTGEASVFCDNVCGETLAHPNDLAFDGAGNIVFTCPGNSRKEPTGYVCAAGADGVARKVITDKFFPNGLAFSEDGKTLVVAETYRHRLWRGDWDAETAQWSNAAPWGEVGGDIGPDGMAFGSDGNLYVAVFGGGAVKVVSPEGGVVDVLALDGRNPSNCAFAPNGGLVVSETQNGELVKFDNAPTGAKLFKR